MGNFPSGEKVINSFPGQEEQPTLLFFCRGWGTVVEGRRELGLDYALTVKVADPKYPRGSSAMAIRLSL